MTKSYRVFTSDPLVSASRNQTSISWITASSRPISPPLPPATLQKAAHQISLLYQNAIFGNGDEEEDSRYWENAEEGHDPTIEWPSTHLDAASTRPDITNVDYVGPDETYDSDLTGDEMTMQSEGSSISRFPAFNFSINTLSSLSSLLRSSGSGTGASRLIVLLGILEVDGPNYVMVKTGGLAGSEISLLKLIVGDEHGAICKLVAWRDTAETWGGITSEPGLKRGDIVLFQNVTVSGASSGTHDQPGSAKPHITASPNLKSSAEICYRTLPSSHEDRRWRPDLRLSDSVPTVRKVREVVNWMERMAGIPSK